MSVAAVEADLLRQFADDVREGLTAERKRLHPRWLYDPLGSTLFDAITLTPEYYLTRTEQGILDEHVDDILDATGNGVELGLVELGAGSSRKTRTIIRALLERQERLTFCPIDISRAALEQAGGLLQLEFPSLEYTPVVGRYRAGLEAHKRDPRRKLVLFIGSSIGNFDPTEAAAFLRDVAAALNPGDRLLLGTDLDKDPDVIQAAYHDSVGVTSAFNLNLLARINRELGGGFDLTRFHHRAVWNGPEHRMEMHLVSDKRQRVPIERLGLEVTFEEGEGIHTENSYKYTMEMVREMIAKGGFRLDASWSDAQDWFGVHLLTPDV